MAKNEEKLKLTLVSRVNLVNIGYWKNGFDENIIAEIFSSLVINFPYFLNFLY